MITMDEIRKDFEKRLDPKQFEAIKDPGVGYCSNYLRKSRVWHRCYALKQRFTHHFSYCFQADFYEFCKLAGFEVKIDDRGDHWVKAQRKKDLTLRKEGIPVLDYSTD